MKAQATIKAVDPKSLAQQAGIAPGDVILTINGEQVYDILDYQFLSCEQRVEITYERGGEVRSAVIENPDYSPLGITFCHELIEPAKSCHNKCVFCFIDQLPKGMRESLYFKDDDVRLSFLMGNYVTLTNLSDFDIDRIIRRKISPINISVHTTNPQLRVKMLSNKNAGKLLERMQKLADNHIEMNTQIVLCPGYNDKAELDRTIGDLFSLYPAVHSISVVPVGLTKHREGLSPMAPFTPQTAAETIDQVTAWQEKALADFGTRVVYLGDEFFIKSKRPIPPEEAYEDFPQIENGVGLLASMAAELEDARQDLPPTVETRQVSIITGVAAKEIMEQAASDLMARYPNLSIHVYPIVNHFLGEQITVAGLVCGCDIIEQLKGVDLGSEAFIPITMLRHETDVFLDDVTLPQLEEALGVPVTPTRCDGYDLTEKLLGISPSA